MPRPFTKRLVIDASVEFSAGKPFAESPVSAGCRDFLEAVREICHRVVVSRELDDEWREHASPFATTWLVQMSQRGRHKYVDLRRRELANQQVRERIENTQVSPKARAAMMKDVHLIEAALATDLIIVSSDGEARALLRQAAQGIKELRGIVWVDPTRTSEDPVGWLRRGARPEKQRRLSYQGEPLP